MAQEFLGGQYDDRSVVTDVVTRRQVQMLNNRIVGRDLPGQRWGVALALYAPDNNALKRRVFAHQLKQGFSKPFLIPMPQDASLPETPVGNVRVLSKGAAGTSEIVPVAGVEKRLYEGQYVGFTGHTKVYAVIEDWAGTGNVKLYPALAEDVAAQSNMTLEPNLYAIHQSAVGFGVDPLTQRRARYIVFQLAEFLG